MQLEQVESALRRPALDAEWRCLVATWPEVEACAMASALGAVRQVREGLLRQVSLILTDEDRPVALFVQYLSLRGVLDRKRDALRALASVPSQACEAARIALELALESRLLLALEELLRPTLSSVASKLAEAWPYQPLEGRGPLARTHASLRAKVG